MDILDRHDFEQLLNEYGRRPAALAEQLEQFFRVEIPARERLRARGKFAPAPAFKADTSEAACAKLAREIAQTIRTNHVILQSGFNEEGVVTYLTDILGEAFAGRMPEIDPAILPPGVARDAVIAENKARHARNDGPRLAEKITRSAGKKPTKARARKRYGGLGIALALTLAACGSPGDDAIAGDDASADGGADVDADPNAPDADPNQPDADPGAPDAGPELPNGAACDPLAIECAGGLTCRITSLDPEGGTCRQAGAAFENDPCDLDNGDDDCGVAMACLGTADPRCYVICDPSNPVPRCGATDTCIQVWGATVELGACSP